MYNDLGPIHIITTEKKEEEMEQKTEKDEKEQETEDEKDHACSTVLKRMNIVILTSPTKGNLSLDNFTWNVFLNI